MRKKILVTTLSLLLLAACSSNSDNTNTEVINTAAKTEENLKIEDSSLFYDLTQNLVGESNFPIIYLDHLAEKNPNVVHFKWPDIAFELPETIDHYEITENGSVLSISKDENLLVTVTSTSMGQDYSPKGFWALIDDYVDGEAIYVEAYENLWSTEVDEKLEEEKSKVFNSIVETVKIQEDLVKDKSVLESDMTNVDVFREALNGEWDVPDEWALNGDEHAISKIAFDNETVAITYNSNQQVHTKYRIDYDFSGIELAILDDRDIKMFKLNLLDISENKLSFSYFTEGEKLQYFIATKGNGDETFPEEIAHEAFKALLEQDTKMLNKYVTKEALESFQNREGLQQLLQQLNNGQIKLNQYAVNNKKYYDAQTVVVNINVYYDEDELSSVQMRLKNTNKGWKVVQ